MGTDFDTLRFPSEIEEVIGLSRNEIGFLKKKGCPFFGRKTTIRWVREFIAKAAGATPVSSEPLHHTESTVSKSCGTELGSGSSVAPTEKKSAKRNRRWK